MFFLRYRWIFFKCMEGRETGYRYFEGCEANPTEFSVEKVHGCTLLMMRQRRCTVYFQKSCYSLDSGTLSGAVFSPSIAENSLNSFLPLEDIRVGIFMITLK